MVLKLRERSAVALEAYFKQANNLEAERKCALVRVRAERKAGQLLLVTAKAKGGEHFKKTTGSNFVPVVDKPKTLAEMGLTKDQSSKWQMQETTTSQNERTPPGKAGLWSPIDANQLGGRYGLYTTSPIETLNRLKQ